MDVDAAANIKDQVRFAIKKHNKNEDRQTETFLPSRKSAKI
jgi:hypothetical protein